jgi:hypothetical protein
MRGAGSVFLQTDPFRLVSGVLKQPVVVYWNISWQEDE